MTQKTVLITGANRGIGLQFVKRYATEGWQVVACCRNPKNAEELNQLAKDYSVTIKQLDITDQEKIKALAESLMKTPIDLLINNAGIIGDDGVCLNNIDVENMLNVFHVNAVAPIKLIEALLPSIQEGKQKQIINISSSMGSIGHNDSGHSLAYRTSKAALNMLSKSIAIELNDKNIYLVMLHPGWVQTDMGGPGAQISTEESVTKMMALISRLKPKNSGHFYKYDGQELPW